MFWLFSLVVYITFLVTYKWLQVCEICSHLRWYAPWSYLFVCFPFHTRSSFLPWKIYLLTILCMPLLKLTLFVYLYISWPFLANWPMVARHSQLTSTKYNTEGVGSWWTGGVMVDAHPGTRVHRQVPEPSRHVFQNCDVFSKLRLAKEKCQFQ